nr:uncharacterized protein LOC129263980 [Lytechinus pictus]
MFDMFDVFLSPDMQEGPTRQLLSEATSFVRAVEEAKHSDFLTDADVLTIAQTMTVNQFYDLGVALGFTITELDRIEYRRIKDRQQATYDMLVIWRERQPTVPEAKNKLILLMQSLDSTTGHISFSDIEATQEIPDTTLLAIARQISAEKFFDIGEKLGFDKSELQHIKHRTLYNRKDANIQMLSSWKADQTSLPEAKETLKRVWESVNRASEAHDLKGGKRGEESKEYEHDNLHHGEENMEEKDIDHHHDNGDEEYGDIDDDDTFHEQMPDGNECNEPEVLEVIIYAESTILDVEEAGDDMDQCGGSPTTGELCSVALPIKSLSLAWELGKALRVDDEDIVGCITPSNPAAMKKLARQLLNRWRKRLERNEREDKITKILNDYIIQDDSKGLEEISKGICTTPDLLVLSQRLDQSASEILQLMCSSLTLEPNLIRQNAVLRMLQRWVKKGGTRQRLLEIAHAFHFNDTAKNIAIAMEHHPGFLDPHSHGMIGHDGGELNLDEPDIRISIPPGAIPKGMGSVVTLTVPRRSSTKIPMGNGEVLISPIIQCSFFEELLKPASISLPHCITLDRCEGDQDVECFKLYTKLKPGKFGYRTLTPQTSSFKITEDKIELSTCHLQLCALSSTNVHGVQFTCTVFHTYCSHIPRLCVRVAHPYSGYLTVPVHSLLVGGCHSCTFDLPPSTANEKKVKACLRIDQGASVLTEHQITISKEAEPDYAISPTRDRKRFASNNMLQVLSDLVCEIKDARELGYKLGFSYSTVEKYLVRADSSARSVSRSGLREMLEHWRRRVRPSEQVEKLQTCLEAVGLRHEAEILFDKN